MAEHYRPKISFEPFIAAKFRTLCILQLLVFWSVCHNSRAYIPLVDNKSLSCLMREWKSILNCIIFRLQGKIFKGFAMIIFVCLRFSIILVSQLWDCIFGWECTIDLLVRHINSQFLIHFFGLFFRTCPAMLLFFFSLYKPYVVNFGFLE